MLRCTSKNDEDQYYVNISNTTYSFVSKDQYGNTIYGGEHIDRLGKIEDFLTPDFTFNDVISLLKNRASKKIFYSPCKVNDIIYLIRNDFDQESPIIVEGRVDYIYLIHSSHQVVLSVYIRQAANKYMEDYWIKVGANQFGKTIFFTKKEAEKKLKEQYPDTHEKVLTWLTQCATNNPYPCSHEMNRENYIRELEEKLQKAESCIDNIEDALDRGTDNDWARECIEEWRTKNG